MIAVRHECDRLDRRRRAILEAAKTLFVSKGFEQTTLGNVVEQAGGSLATVYKLFDNKEGLLSAVVFERIESREELIRSIVAAEPDPVTALTRIAHELQKTMLDPKEIALVRIVIAHSIRNEAFAKRFFSSTARCARDALRDAFENWDTQGIKMSGKPSELADLFTQSDTAWSGSLLDDLEDEIDEVMNEYIEPVGA